MCWVSEKQMALERPPRSTAQAMTLMRKKRTGERISMVTCYDYPSALHVDARLGGA